jgi:hypothetical protein
LYIDLRLMDITARDLRLLAIGAVASVGLGAILTSQYRGNIHQSCRIIDSPLPRIQKTLTREQQKRLPYAPDALEGARDVTTPFGNIRVYEWGPQEGKKVLLMHGISTPCIALGGLAEELVQRGCRVMLFGECVPHVSSLISNPKSARNKISHHRTTTISTNTHIALTGSGFGVGIMLSEEDCHNRSLDSIERSSHIDQGDTVI